MIKAKKVLSSLLAMGILSSFLACNSGGNTSGSGTAANNGTKKEIVLNYLTYRTGQNVGAKYFEPSVARFNKKYAGKYKVVIQEVVQDSYDDKIKQLAQVNKLPTLMDGMHDTTWLKNYVAKNKVSYDLKSWLDQNPDVKKLCIQDSLNYCTINGRVDFMPNIISSPTIAYYNTSMYKPDKKVRDMTSDEFLTSLGNNKIAFMTGENAWTTQLFYSALIASQPGGSDLLSKHTDSKIVDFNNSIFINATTQLQKFLQKTASSNTVGAAYADADNALLSKKAAVIFNGAWMFDDFRASSKNKWSNGFNGDNMTCDLYPGNIALTNNATFGGYWITDSASAEQKEAALAFLKFVSSPSEIEQQILISGGFAPNLTYSESFKKEAAGNRLLTLYTNAFNDKTKIIPEFDDVVYSSVAQPGFPNLLPDLVNNKTTPKEFCNKLTELSKQAAKE